MDLLRSLRCGEHARIALVGAGGKTTAMFQLGRQYLAKGVPRVFVTTTTHLAVEQLGLADQLFISTPPGKILKMSGSLPLGLLLFTGPRVEAERVSGVDDAQLEAIRQLADDCQVPLLIEADGSRRRPLKAPAPHEPVVPIWVDTVVVLAGLSGLGRALDSEWVHRPVIFGALSGLEQGAPITLEAMARVLSDPQGGLKGIQPQARRIALLNQADTAELQAAGGRLARQLVNNAYASALVAALAGSAPGAGGVFYACERVAGIVLAAGGSTRLGRPKQLLYWRGEPLVRRAARTALEAGLSPVVLVSGAFAQQVESAVADLPVKRTYNPDWANGQSTSLAAGLRSLPPDVGAAVFLLSDQPHVSAMLLHGLAALHAETLGMIVAPVVDGRRANPVLFDRDTFLELLTLEGDIGGRALFARYPVSWLPWQADNLLLDIDRVEDYQKLSEES